MEKKSLIHEIKVINGDIFKAISNRYKNMNVDITPVHAKIIMSIYKSKESLCQKDLESSMSCNKSTMSAIISTMEKNGLLIRKVSDLDSRINYLELTNKGLEMALFLKEDRKITEDIMLDGISDEEYLIFTKIVDKIRRNLERI
jgi:DNA-binding MarR family transcriptional regulator